MKTKNLLFAMALPALFAACSSEDFTEAQEGSLKGRALLNPIPAVNLQEGAGTRFAWENYKWQFEADKDKFGASVVDYKALGTIENDGMLGNYIWSKESGKWATTSQMIEGTYLFYSYPGFEKKNTRDLVKFELVSQKTDLKNPAKLIQENAQFFITPLYQIAAKTSGEALPLVFYPYWSSAAFRILNNTEQTLKISQIVLKSQTTKFAVKGSIDPSKLEASNLIYAYDEDEAKYVLQLPEDETRTEEEIFGQTDFAKDVTTVTSIALNCGNYELADKAEVTAYMIVPASEAHTDLEVSIMVVDKDGKSKEIQVKETQAVIAGNPGIYSIGSVGINTLAFTRGKTNPVFGFNTDGKTMKALDVKKENLADAQGYYVDSKAELLSLLNSNRGEIKVYNSGDLCIDEEVANAISKYTGAGIVFQNPIVIKSSAAATRAAASVTLKNTEFKGAVTMESGDFTFGAGVKVVGAMEVKAGKLTLTDGTYTGTLTNKGGEVVINKKDLPVTVTNNKGTVTIAKENKMSKAAITFGASDDNTININDKYTVDVAMIVDKKTTMNVGAEINVTNSLTNNGKVNVAEAGKILGAGTFTNNKDVENKGVIKTTTLNNAADGKVDNYKYFGLDADGTSGAVTNNGKIVMKQSTARVNTTTGAGEIDNTVKGYVTAAAGNKVAVTVSADMSNDEVLKTLGTFTKLYIKDCTWTVDSDDIVSIDGSGTTWNTTINGIDLVLDNAQVNINGTFDVTVANLHIAKSSTVMGANATNSKLTSTGIVTAAASAYLTTEFANVVCPAGGNNNATETVVRYIDSNTTAITGAGTADKTTTFRAAKATAVTMTNTVYTALAGKVVVGKNVTMTITSADAVTYASETTDPRTDAAEKAAILAAATTGIDVTAAASKVALADNGILKVARTVSYKTTTNGDTDVTLTAVWDGENKTWVIE